MPINSEFNNYVVGLGFPSLNPLVLFSRESCPELSHNFIGLESFSTLEVSLQYLSFHLLSLVAEHNSLAELKYLGLSPCQTSSLSFSFLMENSIIILGAHVWE
jgi:hypothetical protein